MALRFHSGLADLMVPANSVTPTPENPNNGDVDEVILSMLTNGVYAPIMANRHTGQIVAGHTRYAALMELGAQMIPVIWTDSDDEEHLRIMLVDNKSARLARMDEAAEFAALKRLAETETGLVGSAYVDRDLERLAAKLMADEQEPLKINLSGGERLIHEITCPECGHSWVRGQGADEE